MTTARNWNLIEVIVRNGIDYRDYEAILIPDGSGCSSRWLAVTWSQLAQFAYSIANTWIKQFQHIIIEQKNKIGKPPVVGIFIPTNENSITPYCVLASIGFTVLSIPTYLSDEYKISICERENVQLIITEEPSVKWAMEYRKKVRNTEIHMLNTETETIVEYAASIHAGKVMEHVRNIDLSTALTRTTTFPVASPRLYLLSSGSTGSPKTILWDKIDGILLSTFQIIGDSKSGKSVKWAVDFSAFTTAALFLCWLVDCPGNKLYILPHSESPTNIDALIKSHQSFSSFRLLPRAMKGLIDRIWAMGETPEEDNKKREHVEFLKSIGSLTCSGGPLDIVTYRKALKLGIKIHILYGTSEAGSVLESDLTLIDEIWEDAAQSKLSEDKLENVYLVKTVDRCCRIHFEVVDGLCIDGQAVYELVCDANDPFFSSPRVANDGTKWRSGDLFRKKSAATHSRRVINGYLYEGRIASMVVLSTGKKVLLSTVEAALGESLQDTGLDNVELVIVGKTEAHLALLVKDFAGHGEALRNVLPRLCSQVASELQYEELSFLSNRIYHLSEREQFVYSMKETACREPNYQLYSSDIRALV